MSIRKALAYSDCSTNMYYYNSIKQKEYHRNHITTAAVAAVTGVTPSSSTMIEQEIQQISLQRPTYTTRRMAAILTRILGIPVNRKRVQRIFRKMGYIWPNDFQNYQEAELVIKDAFTDYNKNRIHSALQYLTPYEFILKWKMQQQIIEEKKKVINIGNERK
jgi:HTH-like domain/Integrase core domain